MVLSRGGTVILYEVAKIIMVENEKHQLIKVHGFQEQLST